MRANQHDTSSAIRPHGSKQFSLRALLLLVAGVAVVLAVCRWDLVMGISLALLVVGVACVIFAVRTRRYGLIFLGACIALSGLGFSGFVAGNSATWVGRHELKVYVLVVDSATLEPVAGAEVELLEGPYAPIEGRPPYVDSAFAATVIEGRTQPLITDESGRTDFLYSFFAAGTENMLEDSSYVDTRRNWLRVMSPGYATTLMPIDRQSTRPQDIRDDSPVFVTVPLGKQ